MYTPVNTSFTVKKWDVMGSSLHGHVCMLNVSCEGSTDICRHGYSHFAKRKLLCISLFNFIIITCITFQILR